MKFFKPEDFTQIVHDKPSTNLPDTLISGFSAAEKANAKLEREGKVVFSQSSDRRYWEDPNDPTTQDASERSDLRALLINIEPIDRYPDHDRETLIANMEEWIEQATDLEHRVNNLTNANKAYKKELESKESIINNLTAALDKKLSKSNSFEKYMDMKLFGFLPKEKCMHPKRDVLYQGGYKEASFKCACGARVQPKEFEEVK